MPIIKSNGLASLVHARPRIMRGRALHEPKAKELHFHVVKYALMHKVNVWNILALFWCWNIQLIARFFDIFKNIRVNAVF